MMNIVRSIRFGLLLFVGTFLGSAHGAEPNRSVDAGPLRVLFVGNSFSYYNNLPAIVAAFARSADPPKILLTKEQTVGGATLEKLWSLQTTSSVLSEERWDYVVLQEQSNRPITYPKGMMEAAQRFDDAIKKQGANTIFFLTWARRGMPEQQLTLNAAYEKVAAQLGAQIAPVGPAWQLALEGNPQLNLYANDGRHPSATGSYIAACVLYLVISGSRQPCAELEQSSVSNADAKLGRDAAWRTVSNLRRNP